MKSFVTMFTMAILLITATVAAAASKDVFSERLFNSYTGAAGAARYSKVFNYGVFTKKSVSIGGVHASGAFAPYSGTTAFVGSSGPTGPWVPLKDKAGNVVTATGNATFDIDSALPYVRAVWTRTKHRVTVWIHYSE